MSTNTSMMFRKDICAGTVSNLAGKKV